MSSAPETRISLEAFHRHFLVTHAKDAAPGVLVDLEQRAARSGRSIGSLLAEWVQCHYPQGGFQDDNWYVKDVPLNCCYFAHTDFRQHPVPRTSPSLISWKDNVRRLMRVCFLVSSEIRAPWSGSMPQPLAQEREPEKYYILDGQLRIIRHWYHHIPKVKVFIYRGRCNL